MAEDAVGPDFIVLLYSWYRFLLLFRLAVVAVAVLFVFAVVVPVGRVGAIAVVVSSVDGFVWVAVCVGMVVVVGRLLLAGSGGVVL